MNDKLSQITLLPPIQSTIICLLHAKRYTYKYKKLRLSNQYNSNENKTILISLADTNDVANSIDNTIPSLYHGHNTNVNHISTK